MRNGDLKGTPLDKREDQTLDEFVTSVELILESLGAERIMSYGGYFRIYQIPEKGGIVGQFGDPIHIKARNMEIDVNASIGYLGMTIEARNKIALALANAGYRKEL